MITGREILLFLTYKYKSNWDLIMDAIRRRDDVDEADIKRVNALVKSDFVTLVDEDYPEGLKKIAQPPFVLFYKGDKSLFKWGNHHKISVVGSRQCSQYGIESTKVIVKNLPNDYLIISGLAKGIDAVSHESALEAKLKTIAVLGDGLSKFYPKENISIFNKIVENGGLVVTEYFDDVSPEPENFINRNRIIAGLCDFLLVTEAYERSGTSITVNQALTFGKDVGCVPYEISKKSICNALIKEGAYLIESAEDIIKIVR
jgi:DNA protecting protein DprA